VRRDVSTVRRGELAGLAAVAATAALGGVGFLNGVAIGAAYVAGAAVHRRRAGAWPARRTGMFLAAVLVLSVATSGAADAHARDALAWHMVQQMTLLFAVPLGLLAGRPDVLLRRVAGWDLRPAAGLPALGGAWAFFVGIQWFVHIPAVLDIAVRYEAAWAALHWAQVASGVVFFANAFAVALSGQRHPFVIGLYLVGVMPATDVIGLWLLFDPNVIYQHYAGPGALVDQRRAGAVMFTGGMIPLFCTAWMAYRYLTPGGLTRRPAVGR
jgi:cytochrome c oxidase assembly factor CtaG